MNGIDLGDVSQIIVGLATLLLAGWTVFSAWKIQKVTKASTDADASVKYGEAAEIAIERALHLDKQLRDQSDRLHKVEVCVAKLKIQNNMLREWIKRLQAQLVSLGAKPVEMPEIKDINDDDCTKEGV